MITLAITASLLCVGSFAAGYAAGLWRKHSMAAEHYRLGRTAGFNDARQQYGQIAPEGVRFPTLKSFIRGDQ
jgi:hypothetical protein